MYGCMGKVGFEMGMELHMRDAAIMGFYGYGYERDCF